MTTKVLISDKELAFILNQELVKKINKNIPRFAKAIKPDAQELVRQALKDDVTYDALTKGGPRGVSEKANVDLAAEFGFPAGTERDHVDPLINTVAKGVSVTSTRGRVDGARINIGINIVLYKDDFIKELKKLDTAIITAKNAKGQTFLLPWVAWLFEKGTEIVIDEYRIRYVNSPSSRSGKAIMIPKGSWSVPAYYAGTKDSNWVTRALNFSRTLGYLSTRMSFIFNKHVGLLT